MKRWMQSSRTSTSSESESVGPTTSTPTESLRPSGNTNVRPDELSWRPHHIAECTKPGLVREGLLSINALEPSARDLTLARRGSFGA